MAIFCTLIDILHIKFKMNSDTGMPVETGILFK